MNEQEYIEMYRLLGKVRYKSVETLQKRNLREEYRKEIELNIQGIDRLLAGGIPIEFIKEAN